ncbi:hypothetical protein [Albibacillus kandeliae]|uniref:hypothetical protein n=1 Tax=Albibacillus kandeliae TaxID=2174228 RepID=UPI000D68A059|nr:hypothetical protein [Albibacillus kandeliae]
MGDVNLKGPELKKLVKLTKKKPLAFAYSPGKKPEESVFAIDKRKTPGMLGKLAKKESTGMKVAYGMCSVEKKLMTLTCESVVPTMAKSLKKLLKKDKVNLNIVIIGPDGKELESDIEDLPDDPEFDDDTIGFDEDDAEDAQDDAQEGETGESEEDEDGKEDLVALQKALATRLKAVQPTIFATQGTIGEKLRALLAAAVGQLKSGDLQAAEKSVATLEAAVAKLGNVAKEAPEAPQAPTQETSSNDEAKDKPAPGNQQDARALAARAASVKQAIDGLQDPIKSKLLAALGQAAKMIKEGQLETAAIALDRIEDATQKAMSQTGDQTATSPEQKKWEAAESKLQPLVDKAMADKRGDLDAINRAFNYAKELAADGAYDRALAAAGKVAELLKAAATMTGTAAAQEADASIPANLVPYVQSRLAWIKTRAALRSELAGLKSAIDSMTADVEGLEDVSSKTSSLFNYLNDIDSNLEDTLEQLVEAPEGDARDKLKAKARQIVDSYRGVLDGEFFKDVDNNGFVQTNIRGAALASLGEVSDALAA